MTVVFVNSTRKWGGVKTWTLNFGTALARRGHRVVAVVRPGTSFEDACREAGFVVHPVRFGFKYNPAAVARVAAVFLRERPAVAVVNISRDLEVGAVAARLTGVPVVHRVGLVEDYRGTLEERLRHRFLVDRVLVPAAWMREALLAERAWIRPEQVAVVPNGRDVRSFPLARGSGTGEVVFGCASQLSPSKGHRTLLEALARLRAEGLAVRLRVAGTGSGEAALRARAGELGIGEAVELCGFVGSIAQFLSGLDAFVLPSLKEGFPNALLEALCAGLPAVASDLPGTREMADGISLLVPPGRPEALAEAMGRLARDPALRRELGAAARRRAEARYDLEANAAALEALLREVARP